MTTEKQRESGRKAERKRTENDINHLKLQEIAALLTIWDTSEDKTEHEILVEIERIVKGEPEPDPKREQVEARVKELYANRPKDFIVNPIQRAAYVDSLYEKACQEIGYPIKNFESKP
jgi:hypothetical protein